MSKREIALSMVLNLKLQDSALKNANLPDIRPREMLWMVARISKSVNFI